MGNVRKLTEEEIQDKLSSYAEHPDNRIRDEIVLQYANLVESIGRRFVGACEPLEDLIQEGYIGLIASVDKYDGNKGVKFSTYATHFIIGQIKHYLRDKGKIIKEPAWLQELNQKMTRVIEALNQKLGRQPNEKEISEVMQLPERTVREMLTTREVFKVTSLDGGSSDKDDSSSMNDAEKITDDKIVSFQLPLEDKIVLETALNRLKDIEQQVIADHFYKGLNQTEIAKKLGISCNYVSHILRNSTKKLKRILTTDEIRDSHIQRVLVVNRTTDMTSEPSSVLDELTGVYNREYFGERLDEEVSRAFREKSNLCVMLVNVELPENLDPYVKMVRLDDYLFNIAQSLKNSVRKVDFLARFGETSFALILPHTSNNWNVIANRLTEVVDNVSMEGNKKAVKILGKAVIGAAVYPLDAQDSASLIIKAAESAGVVSKEETVLKKAA